MTEILRPRFGQPCFECRETVPAQRVRALQEKVALQGRAWRKDDLLCVDCQKSRDVAEGHSATDPQAYR